MALCHDLLRGAIDLHTHSAPSLFDRLLDDVALAEQARAAGMRAVLYKAHEQDTTGRAALVRRAVAGIHAFGGIVLNHVVGGLNPTAVDASIKLAPGWSGCRRCRPSTTSRSSAAATSARG